MPSLAAATRSLSVLSTLSILALGCGKDPEFPEPPPPMDAPPPVPVATTEPPPPPPPAAPSTCDAVQSTAFTTMLLGRQTVEAPRMEAVGGLVCGVAPVGQAVDGPTFMLEPGYCYTVLGNALPNVTELDLAMVLDLSGGGIPPVLAGLAATPLAVDNTTGPTAAIGPKDQCYQWAFPIPATVKLSIKAREGDGPVAAQVYRRRK